MIYSVLLKTPLAAGSGYGHDGFALARNFHEAGLDVHLAPINVIPPIPQGVAKLLVKGSLVDYDYLIHHVWPEIMGLTDGEKRLKAKKVAWSMWEFLQMDPGIGETLAERLDGYDELLVYDEVSYEAYRPYADKAEVPMRILQGGFQADEWEFDARQRDWNKPFRFVMAGQLHARKNPMAAITAFNRLRAERNEVELHLKTNVRTLHPAMEDAYPGLKIHYTIWTHEEMRQFYANAHCYVAPSWGEGKNLPALEAQAMGIPVIYSDFGGHRQWGSKEFGWPVDGTLEEHDGTGLTSFRIDPDGLYEAMREAVENRSETKRKGEIAQRTIPVMCSWTNVVQRVLDTIKR